MVSFFNNDAKESAFCLSLREKTHAESQSISRFAGCGQVENDVWPLFFGVTTEVTTSIPWTYTTVTSIPTTVRTIGVKEETEEASFSPAGTHNKSDTGDVPNTSDESSQAVKTKSEGSESERSKNSATLTSTNVEGRVLTQTSTWYPDQTGDSQENGDVSSYSLLTPSSGLCLLLVFRALFITFNPFRIC